MLMVQERRKTPLSVQNWHFGTWTSCRTENHLGSTAAVINDKGELIEATMYTAYGEQIPLMVLPGTEAAAREKFTGKEFDTEGGMNLDYFGKRFLDPEIGVWTSIDPKGQFYSGYSYTTNPVNETDPNGEWVAAIFAATQWYLGGVLSSGGEFNPGKWNWKDPGLLMSTALAAFSVGMDLGRDFAQIQANSARQNSYKPGLRAGDLQLGSQSGNGSSSDLYAANGNSEPAVGLSPAPSGSRIDAGTYAGGNGSSKKLLDLKLYSKRELVSRYSPDMPPTSWIEKRALNIDVIGIAGGEDGTLFSFRREGYYRGRWSLFREVDVRFKLEWPLDVSIYNQRAGRLFDAKSYEFLGAEWKPWISQE